MAAHITSLERGNFRRDIFFDDQDRQTYLHQLAEAANDAQLRIWGHCLVSNHIPLVVVPERADSMARAFRIAHSNYSRWLNIRLRRCGHVWQNRYFSCPLDPAHAAYAMRHVEFNPVRAGVVESVLDYAWSSAEAHVGLDAAPPWHGTQDWITGTGNALITGTGNAFTFRITGTDNAFTFTNVLIIRVLSVF